jgi:hypothetical protein
MQCRAHAASNVEFHGHVSAVLHAERILKSETSTHAERSEAGRIKAASYWRVYNGGRFAR